MRTVRRVRTVRVRTVRVRTVLSKSHAQAASADVLHLARPAVLAKWFVIAALSEYANCLRGVVAMRDATGGLQ